VGERWDSEAAEHRAEGVQPVERTVDAPEGARTGVMLCQAHPFNSGIDSLYARITPSRIMPKPMKLYAFRLPHLLARRLNAVAKLYGATPSAFLRDMVEATCVGDQEKSIAFTSRLQERMTKQIQLEFLAKGRAAEREKERGPRDRTT
jgi:predicted DNA-binding protein